jgi:putative ABC transport system permease protein
MISDLLCAVRWLYKNPFFTLAVTAILALGIGANTAVFSIVDAVLLRPLPYQSSDRLIRIEEESPKRLQSGIPAADYLFWRDRTDLFDKTIPFLRDFVTMTGAGDPDQVISVRIGAGIFSVLGAHARLGRPLAESDGEFNVPNAAVLSDRFWHRHFHGDPRVVGRAIVVADEIFTIVGVMPPEFEFDSSNTEMWLPLRVTPTSVGVMQVIARMKPGVSTSQIESALQVTARQLIEQDPKDKAGLHFKISPWRETVGRQYELTLVFILVAVGLVLLIACADVGGLLLSCAVQRQKEIAIRASLGAGFWRVMQQLLAESLALAVLGSAAGITVAYYTLQFLSKQMAALPIAIPHLQRVALNGRVLLFNTVLCLLLACIFSVAPVLMASKTDLQLALRGGQGGGSRRSSRLFSLLIAVETAFAFLLLTGSGLMIRSLVRLQEADHGFHPDHVLTMRVPVGSLTRPRPNGQYDTRARQMAYYHDLMERLERTPGIGAVAVVNNLPLSGVNTTIAFKGPDGQPMLTSTRTISPQYFAAMAIPLLKGRTFTDADQAGAPPVAIINEYLARQLFPGRDPLGQTLPHPDSTEPGSTVIGVVRDSSQRSYEEPAKGEVYMSYRQLIFGAFMSTVVVRTSGDPLAVAATLSKEVWEVDPNQPIVKVETMNDVVAESIWRPRFSAWVFSVLGGLALLLTSVGVYGVVAYTTELRAREVGIRVALGATPRNVVAVILRGAMIPLVAGLVISVVAAVLLSRLLTDLLYEIRGTDPSTYVGAGVLLLAIGVIASVRPAWRAAVADPLKALRTE